MGRGLHQEMNLLFLQSPPQPPTSSSWHPGLHYCISYCHVEAIRVLFSCWSYARSRETIQAPRVINEAAVGASICVHTPSEGLG